jgi:hypothetical protein
MRGHCVSVRRCHTRNRRENLDGHDDDDDDDDEEQQSRESTESMANRLSPRSSGPKQSKSRDD